MLNHIYTDFKGNVCPSEGICYPIISNLQLCNVCNNDIKDKSLAHYIKNEWLLDCFLEKKKILSKYNVNYLWSCKNETKKLDAVVAAAL